MTLKQLISRYTWLNIEAELLQEYPREQKNLAAYEAVYYQLLLLPMAETDLQIGLKRISYTHADGAVSQHVDVCGRKQTPHVADVPICLDYTLDFTPWVEWLSMPVSAKTLRNFSETEIIVHCLWGMTFYAFDEASIQARAIRISNEIDKIMGMTGKERQAYPDAWGTIKSLIEL